AFDDVQLGPVGGVGELLGEGRLVVLAVGVGQVDERLGATADQEGAASEQVASLAHALGVNVGLWQHAATEQDSDLVGVDFVGLGLAAVDGLHVESVSQDEGDLLLLTAVG